MLLPGAFQLVWQNLSYLVLSGTYPMPGLLFSTLSGQKVRNLSEPNKRAKQYADLLQPPRHPAKCLRGQHPWQLA